MIVRLREPDTLYGVAVPGNVFFTTCDPVQKPDANTPCRDKRFNGFD